MVLLSERWGAVRCVWLFVIVRVRSWSRGRTDGQTEGQTDMTDGRGLKDGQTDGRTCLRLKLSVTSSECCWEFEEKIGKKLGKNHFTSLKKNERNLIIPLKKQQRPQPVWNEKLWGALLYHTSPKSFFVRGEPVDVDEIFNPVPISLFFRKLPGRLRKLDLVLVWSCSIVAESCSLRRFHSLS